MDSSKASLNEFNAACDSSEQAYQSLGDALKNNYLSGKISAEEYYAKSLQNQNKYIKEQIALIKERATLIGKDKAGVDFSAPAQNKGTSPFVSYKNIDEAKKKYLQMKAAVLEGKDYFEKYQTGFSGWINSVFTTVNATEEQAKSFGNVIATDLLKRMDDIANKQGPAAEKAIKDLVNLMNNDNATRTFISKLDEDLKDEALKKNLKVLIKYFKELNAEIERNHASAMERCRIDAYAEPFKR